MKSILSLSLLVVVFAQGVGQTTTGVLSQSNKGKLYFYWGWNWSGYTNSNIHFKGDNYDFTLKKVVAKDRPSKFSFETYFHPKKLTMPQYNFRVGYYFKDDWDISFGIDHMKYVIKQNQTTTIDGYIANTNSAYDNTYNNQSILIDEKFLMFEHSDGLNYVNFELRHTDEFLSFKNISISLKEGIGVGFLYPRTNTTLLGKERYDEFHLSGYGISGVLGINITFYDKFFFQTEYKGGFIDMPSVRTTLSKADTASHNFFFSQFNILFGGVIRLKSSKKISAVSKLLFNTMTAY